MLGVIVYRGMSIISLIIAARLIGTKGFGELGITLDTVTMFQIFAGLGLGLTATKYVAELKNQNPRRAGRIIGLSRIIALATGSLCSIALLIFSPWICSVILAAPELVEIFRIASLLLFFSAINGYQVGVLTGLEAFKVIAIINILIGIIGLPLIVIFVMWWGVKGAILGLAVSVSFNLILNTFALREQLHKAGIVVDNTFECFREKSALWNFSLPAALSGFMVTPAIWICDAILVNTRNGYQEMGVFTAANQWRMAILFLPNVLSAVILPFLANLLGENNRPKYKVVLKYSLLFNTGIASVGAVLVILFVPIIILLYGKGFSDSKIVFIILSLSTILTALNSVIGQAIVSSGRVWYSFLFNLLWASALVFLAKLFIPLKGAQGFAYAFLGSYVLHSMWQSLYLIRILKYKAT